MLSTDKYADVLSIARARLTQLRNALDDCGELEAFLSGVTQADLVAAGGTAADAQAVLNAMADANGLNQLYTTGTDPRNVGPGYVYGATQRVVIGPN